MITKEQIKQARLNSGLTQKEAAKLVHIGLRTWQDGEGGTHKMSLANFELFCIKTNQQDYFNKAINNS